MVSTASASAPPRRLSVHATSGSTVSTASVSAATSSDDHENALAQSLGQLSLATSTDPKHGDATRRPHPSRPPSRSPAHRLPSKSPSGRQSRSQTPPLLRKASMNSLRSAARAPSSRRSSVTTQTVSPKLTRSPSVGVLRAAAEEQHAAAAPLTAASVAAEYFRSEMRIHHGQEAALPTDTIVILHDAVYGHRFSRPRTSRGALSTIVERPERVKAAVLGVSVAYVRLGERHDQGAFPIHPRANITDIPKIPFRIRTSTRALPLTSSAVTNVHGRKWMEELKVMCETAESKLALGGRELQRPENVERDEPAQALHQGDLYLCSESLDAMEGALGAVCDGVDAVFDRNPTAPRRAFVAVRPPGHHCAAAHPSGFCWVNNVLVGIMHGALTHGLTHAAIIDFDLHHGDGSQAIVWQHNARANAAAKNAQPWKKTSIGYFSLHDINSYPCEMGDENKVKNASLCIDNAHGQTVWNVHLESWKTEAQFWAVYESKYSVILHKARTYLDQQALKVRAQGREPRGAIFFSAGFDASEWESAGMQRHQVNVPTEFYARLSQDVVKIANEEGLHVDGRIVSVLEGGYSDRALFSGVFSHLSGLVGDQSVHVTENGHGISYGTGQKLGTIAEPEQEATQTQRPAVPSLHKYDANWWSSQQLDCIESLVSSPQSPPRKPRVNTPPTYFSPTQASSAKVTDPAKMRRSLSGLSSTIQRPRASSPVAPDVAWTVAAHELSKILIPTHRQTDSCRAEDLNAEATRVRRERQTILLGPPPPPVPPAESRPTSRMSLRERKPRSAAEETGERTRLPASPTKQAGARSARPRSAGAEQDAACGGQRRRRSGRLSESAAASRSPPEVEETVPVPSLPAEYEHLASRPPTSNSSHAGSSVSGQMPGALAVPTSTLASTPAPTPAKLPVKKTRQKTTVTTGTKDAVAPKTPRATTRRPVTTTAATTTPSRKTRTVSKPLAAEQPKSAPLSPLMSATGPSEELPATVPSVDNITQGMKKIRINLITQSQREARNAAAAAAAGEMSLVPDTVDDEDGSSPSRAMRSDGGLEVGSGSGVLSEVGSPSPLERRVLGGGGGPREEPLRFLPTNALTKGVLGTGTMGEEGTKEERRGTVSGLFEYTANGIPFASGE